VKIGGWKEVNEIVAKKLGINLADHEQFNNIADEFTAAFPDSRVVITSTRKPSGHPMHPEETLYAVFDTIEAAAAFKLTYV
jgi:hypothetical protein